MITPNHIISLVGSTFAVGGWFIFAGAFLGGGGMYLLSSFGVYAIIGLVAFSMLYIYLVWYYGKMTRQNNQDIIKRTPRGIEMINDPSSEHLKYEIQTNSYSWLVFHIQYWGLVVGTITTASFFHHFVVG